MNQDMVSVPGRVNPSSQPTTRVSGILSTGKVVLVTAASGWGRP
jgi:hypothetical protein